MSQTTSQKALLKKIFEKDIEAFSRFFFPHHLTKPPPPFHRELFSLYEQADVTRIVAGAPRGHAKSTITGLCYLLWEAIHGKRKFILLISDTHSQATLFLDTVKAEIEGNERIQEFYGNLKSDVRWSEAEVIIGKTMVKALGATASVRGLKYMQYRPDLAIIDDLENDEAVLSKERREKMEHWFNATLLPAMAIHGRIVMIGTVLHYDSLLNKLLDKDKYSSFTKRMYRAIQDDGTALWPEHLSLEDLEKMRQEYKERGLSFQFSAEYLNDPVSGDHQKFKREETAFYNEEELASQQYLTYMTVDRAYSTAKTSDFTAFVVVSVSKDNFWYVRHAERLRAAEPEVIDKFFALCSYWNPVTIGFEQKAYKYTLKHVLDTEMRKRNQFLKIVELKDGGKSKNMRIEGLEAQFVSGQIKFLRSQHDLLDELYLFPRSPFDDLSDALAYISDIADTPYVTKTRKKRYTPLTRYGG